MPGNRVIQVALPDGAEPTREDLELLQGLFEAIVSLRFGHGGAGDEAQQALVAGGWTVQSRLMWVAEARRGGESELGRGASRADALAHLEQIVKADQVISPP